MNSTVGILFSNSPETDVVAKKGVARAVVTEATETKLELLQSLAKQLSFPEYVGKNWDALDEALLDLLPNQGRPVRILHRVLPPISIEDLRLYLRVIASVARERLARGDPPLEAIFPLNVRETVVALLRNQAE